MMHIHFYTSALIVLKIPPKAGMNIVNICPERSRKTCGERSRTIYGLPKRIIEPFNHEKK
jgi:hypothetical protein